MLPFQALMAISDDGGNVLIEAVASEEPTMFTEVAECVRNSLPNKKVNQKSP